MIVSYVSEEDQVVLFEMERSDGDIPKNEDANGVGDI